MDTHQFLEEMREELLHINNWQKVIMSRQWASNIPAVAGVYVFKHNENLVYVGETGNLRGRMYDLLDSRHHTIRRTIGEKFFSSEEGFVKATSKKKFPDHIEAFVNNHICANLLFAFLQVQLGRKELEEMVEKQIKLEIKLNKRGKRK